jgi:ribonuclease HIII
MAGVWSEVLLEGHYNRLVGATRNKAVVLLGMTMRLVQQISDAHPDGEIRFFIDKQGARDRYGPLLMKSFEDRRLKVLHEDATHSAYELLGKRGGWRISFRQSGESHHMAVALASCVSKYLRELFMSCFNDYWRRQAPKVRPTAGYYRDGLRFLGEIDPTIASLGIARDRLVRIR